MKLSFIKKLNGEAKVIVLFLILNTIYLIEALNVASPFMNGTISYSFFPILLSILLYPLCFIILFKNININKDGQIDSKILKKQITLVLIMLIYVSLLKPIGFILSSILFVFSFIILFDNKSRNIMYRLFLSVSITAVSYVLFELLLDVHLPTLGIWGVL